ncbi:hypothetical protein [Lentilactobacillus hilgardii]|uniref:hypothetical protein n=1 Tax=Lentilactobacillus hilgardii TaxID=1588 RepID=UPI003FA549AD
MKKKWVLVSLVFGLLWGVFSLNQFDAHAVTDPSADSSYLNDSMTWTHYFYNKKTVGTHNAYIWNLTHTKRLHNLNNYKNTDWYAYSFYNKKKAGHTYKYLKITNYNKSIIGVVYSKFLTLSATKDVTSFTSDSSYLNYIQSAQSQKLARGILKMFPNAPLSLDASKFIQSPAANNLDTQTTYKKVINFSNIAYPVTVTQLGPVQSRLNKFQNKLGSV